MTVSTREEGRAHDRDEARTPPSRDRLLRRMREHLEQSSYPRLETVVLVSLAGMSGFIVSFALLSAGMTSMPVRYALAGLSGYVSFLALLGLYIAWKRRFEGNIDIAADTLDLASHARPSSPSGGRGASESRSGSGGDEVVSGSWLDGFDDLGWVVLALVAAVAGLIAVGSIVWAAPALLAEVLVDALIVSTVSRHLADSDRPDWTMTAIRRTWVPATIVILAMVSGGWALQQIAPDAASIGPALRAITGR